MKKFYLTLALLGCVPFAAVSQTILNEDFESTSVITYDPNLPTGWSSVDTYDGNNDEYRWTVNYTSNSLADSHQATVTGSMFGDDDGVGPREEMLLTPELNLDNTYQLSFLWKVAQSILSDKDCDLQVRVVENDDTDNAETIWSIWDQEALENSGIIGSISGWVTYSSYIDLSEYQGKKVKLAFVFVMFGETGNSVYVDNVKVEQFTPATAPIAKLSKRSYNFGDIYMGAKMYSEAITLSNDGKNGLKIEDIELPAGFSTTLDPATVDLRKNESVSFNVAYHATQESVTSGAIVFKTNGGEVVLNVKAAKQMLPADATFEGFENGFPPAGWTSQDWGVMYGANTLEGDYVAYAAGSMSGPCYLTTPRLDLSGGKEQSVTFTYMDSYLSEFGEGSDNNVTLEFSTDGGNSWNTVWTAPYNEYDVVTTETVSLGTVDSDNCYLRWAYSEVVFDTETTPRLSTFYLGCAILPKYYGIGGIPEVSSVVTPEDKATDIYNKDVELEWTKALFATGYKLYVGSDAAASNLINGEDLGDVTTYTIPSCEYGTTYNWKVVPYNDKGEAANVPVWSFTIIADQTIDTFPYSEGFENGFPPLGWRVTNDGSWTEWDYSTSYAFEGTTSAVVGCYAEESTSSLEMPEVELPADTPMTMSFYWGNDYPVGLEKDESGLVKNTSTTDDGIDACFFEINDGGEWKQLAIFSDKNNKYWCRESVDLSAYAGKTVSFRWRYVGHNYDKSEGAALDVVRIAPTSEAGAAFNMTEWNAGTVNYQESVTTTTPYSIVNDGTSTVTIKSAEFSTENFTSTLAAGTKIEAGSGIPFTMTFNALDTSSEVTDNLVVTFEEGGSISLAVTGLALASDTRYYNFENETAGTMTPQGFTTIDVDKKGTLQLTGMDYPMYGVPFAFCVQDDNTWNNVFKPVSGTKVLVALVPDDYSTADDWIVSKGMTATAESQFRFYARNWESTSSILPGTPSSVQVLVSTTSATDTESFEEVMPLTEMPYYDGEWEEFIVPLGKYAGQKIYIAVRHTVTDGLAAFFDDFYFEHFAEFNSVSSSIADVEVSVYPNPATSTVYLKGVKEADVTICNIAGAVVKVEKGVNEVNVSDLAAGVYLMTIESEQGATTTRFVKK